MMSLLGFNPILIKGRSVLNDSVKEPIPKTEWSDFIMGG